MSDKPWTPGPWEHIVKLEGHTAVGATTIIARVFSCSYKDFAHEEANEEANARLIAAAPDLYDALAGVMALIEEGKLVRDTSTDSDPSFAMRQLPFVMALSAADKALAKARGSTGLSGSEDIA